MKKLNERHVFSLALFTILIVATLAACAPAIGDEPAAAPIESVLEDKADAEGEGSGLATLAPTASLDQPAPAPPANTLNSETAVERIEESVMDEEERTKAEIVEAVTPAVVDLSKITPEPSGEREVLQEMPQPGIPNPSAAASNKAAVDFADQLGIDVGEVQIVSIEQVEWPDSSLGCAKSGQNYLMVITPGFRIILEANGEMAEYHADMQGRIVRCEGRDKFQGGPLER